MSALTNDPDTVIDFMKQLTSGLYSALDKQMKGTNLRSTYTIYNDKQMASEYSNYTTTIKQWEEKIQDYEDRYYSQFSKMESSLAKLQSSTSSERFKNGWQTALRFVRSKTLRISALRQ